MGKLIDVCLCSDECVQDLHSATPNCDEPYRLLDKEQNIGSAALIKSWWEELVQRIGMRVNYYSNGTTLSGMNLVYGEDPTAPYTFLGSTIMAVDITNDTILLSKFGIMADCDMTGILPISTFQEMFGIGVEPKAGDLIELAEFGSDRPGGRGAAIYQITERDDEYLPMTNTLMGHYAWYIKCKRWEYSFEQGVGPEPANDQISDTGGYGILPGGANPDNIIDPVPSDVEEESKAVFDYSTTEIENPYGNY